MLKLYGQRRSRATRPIWLALEAGLDLEVVLVRLAPKLANPTAEDAPLNTRSPAFLALSPTGAVPLLDDNGFILSESLAITLYLAKTYGGDLGPRTAQEEAKMSEWSFFGATWIEEAALAVQMAAQRGAEPVEFVSLGKKLARPLEMLDAHLAAQPYLVGGRFSVADINLAEIVRYASSHAPLLAPYPEITAWLERLHARPAFQEMWALREAEPV